MNASPAMAGMVRDHEVSAKQVVLVDARCLQDLQFRDRGIGQHVTSLLRGSTGRLRNGRRVQLIAAVDRALPPLEPRHRQLFAGEQRIAAMPAPGTLFVQMSPMTHSARPLEAVLASAEVRSVAVVYDFIPLEFPGLYLRDRTSREIYLELLTTLSLYERFVSISDHSSRRLQEILGIQPKRCHVSGVAVRESVIDVPMTSRERYCLAVLGDDPRKNIEAAVIAHGRSAVLKSAGVLLKVVGHYSPSSRDRLRKLHQGQGGDPSQLQFMEGLEDRELAHLYGGALVTICPSRAEGFSIPVVEANANSCPVIVSDCGAQTELMPLADYQFDPDDHERVRQLIERFLDPDHGRRALERQGRFWIRNEARSVQDRFWRAALTDVEADNPIEAPFVARRARPRLAVVSPVPPDLSGVADYTLATMSALAGRADLDLYTETQGRISNRAFSSIRPLSRDPYLRGGHDAVLSVIGNSHYHRGIFDLLLEHGGACVAHDARMIHFYAALLGRERTLSVAGRELGRPVEWPEIEGWLANQRRMPIQFLSELLEASDPVFVHSAVTRDVVRAKYDAETTYLPFAIYRTMLPEFTGPHAREHARALLGYQSHEKVLISLGDIVDDKAIQECIWTAAMLVSWKVPVRLVLAGRSDPVLARHLRQLASSLGLDRHVEISDGLVEERTYQMLLVGADAAIQFRTYGFGGLSGALLDEIAVGLPAVANAGLAEAMQAPSYVATVPNGISPVLAAERVAALFEQGDGARREEERQAFVVEHSVDVYATRLLEGLGLS